MTASVMVLLLIGACPQLETRRAEAVKEFAAKFKDATVRQDVQAVLGMYSVGGASCGDMYLSREVLRRDLLDPEGQLNAFFFDDAKFRSLASDMFPMSLAAFFSRAKQLTVKLDGAPTGPTCGEVCFTYVADNLSYRPRFCTVYSRSESKWIFSRAPFGC